jgi:hypothetical protein
VSILAGEAAEGKGNDTWNTVNLCSAGSLKTVVKEQQRADIDLARTLNQQTIIHSFLK